MAKVVPQTIGELLHWSYANLAMMHSILEAGGNKLSKVGYMIRARLYKGLRTGTINIGSYFDDEKLRLNVPRGCWYCGSEERLSVDHIIPQLKHGADGGENLVHACRSCNSSKGSKDLLAWMNSQGRFPPLLLLRRYLKMAINLCEKHGLMDITLAEARRLDIELPFTIDLVPHGYPPPKELCLFVERRQINGSATSQ